LSFSATTIRQFGSGTYQPLLASGRAIQDTLSPDAARDLIDTFTGLQMVQSTK
jgi:hypothetical protein